MHKIERVLHSVSGGEVDRPPFSFWYHLGLQHLPGPSHGDAEVGFYRAYDLDFLKVMNDYPYPLPAKLDALKTEEDWKRIEPLDSSRSCWQEQLSALSFINKAIGNEALFIETIFSPWTTARRLAVTGGLAEAQRDFPETLLSAMDSIAISLANYAKEAVARGAAGIFLSLGAASSDVMTPEEYALWCRPYDLRILSAVREARLNVLHIHGRNIHFRALLDYPVSALNWSHHSTGPTLKEGMALSGKTVLGGIDEVSASHLSAPEIRNQVRDAIAEVGVLKVMITPGCSVPTDTPARNLRAIRDAVMSAAARGEY